MAKRSRQRFTDEFRAETVALVRNSGKPIADVCRDLGIGQSTLYRWLAQVEIDAGRRQGLSTAEREELARLRRELRVVQEERDILAKAIAFFSKEPTR
jgi:transposase